MRAEAKAFTEARKFQVKERIIDDLVVDRVDFVQYRVARGYSVFAANGKFDNLHLEQGGRRGLDGRLTRDAPRRSA